MALRQWVLCLALGVNVFTCLRFACRFYEHGTLVPDAFTIVGLLFGLMFADVVRLRPAGSHSAATLVVQYTTQKLFHAIGSLLFLRLKKMSRSVENQQKYVLQSILNQNRNTLCVKSFGLSNVDSVSEFIETVPLTTYADYEGLARVVEDVGQEDVFFPGKADYIALTSGTTSGKSKKFPKSLRIMKQTIGKWLCLAQRDFLHVPQNHYLRKWLTVNIKPRIFYSKSGIRCGPISGLAADLSLNYYVMPKEVIVESKEENVIYVHLLFGLMEQDISCLFFSTSQIALIFFKIMETKWEQLCDDIEKGVVSLSVDIPCEQRTCIEKHLKGGSSARARFLRQQFSLGVKDIVPRIWPTCPALFCMATGSFLTKANLIRESYMGHVPIYSPFHAGTETVYGVNINLEEPEVAYLAMTSYNFFEFIPATDINSDCPRTLLAHEVEDGAMYELVVTTYEGLYRYRTEDIVQIRGFYGTIPKYKFICRAGDILSACTEHVPEWLLGDAVRSAASQWQSPLLEFTSTENFYVENLTGEVTGRQYYIVFVELSSTKDNLTCQQKLMVDRNLCKLHEVYAMFRASDRMQSVKVVEVTEGTFDSFRQYYIGLNPSTSAMQFKLPRILRRPEYLKFIIGQKKKCDMTNIDL